MKLPVSYSEISVRKTPLFIIGGILALYITILYKTSNYDTGSIAAGLGLLFFFIIYYLLLKKKLVIDNTGITQQQFFGKAGAIKWEDIKSSRLTWHFHGHGGNLFWEFAKNNGEKITLQPLFFSRKNKRLIAETLLNKCPNIEADVRIIKMAEGKFPWYIF